MRRRRHESSLSYRAMKKRDVSDAEAAVLHEDLIILEAMVTMGREALPAAK